MSAEFLATLVLGGLAVYLLEQISRHLLHIKRLLAVQTGQRVN